MIFRNYRKHLESPYSSPFLVWRGYWQGEHWPSKSMIWPSKSMILAFQEYDFIIIYRKDSEHQNIDALSRQFEHHSAATAVYLQFTEDLKLHLRQDKVICLLYKDLLHHPRPPRTQEWCCSPLKRYRQLWSQLLVKEDLVCRQYTPGPASEPLTIPIIPTSY